jgi:hypothetical protein
MMDDMGGGMMDRMGGMMRKKFYAGCLWLKP